MNHIIDPTFFFDAIEWFSFNYTIYTVVEKDVDEYGRYTYRYDKQSIRGSLQSEGSNLIQSTNGNTVSKTYNFYCKAIYRIEIEDIICYNNNYYRVTSINNDYDEYGVRGATLIAIDLTQYRDLMNYIDYLNGLKTI